MLACYHITSGFLLSGCQNHGFRETGNQKAKQTLITGMGLNACVVVWSNRRELDTPSETTMRSPALSIRLELSNSLGSNLSSISSLNPAYIHTPMHVSICTNPCMTRNDKKTNSKPVVGLGATKGKSLLGA